MTHEDRLLLAATAIGIAMGLVLLMATPEDREIIGFASMAFLIVSWSH